MFIALCIPTAKFPVYIRVYIRVILGLYRDNGKENGDYYLGS